MSGGAPVLGPIGELRAHALAYAERGLEVFPVNPRDKTPHQSQYDATTDKTTIEAWWERWPGALIGHRVAVDQLITDIDPRHGGLTTWKALKQEIGPLPITRVHASGRGDGGGHLWWQRPLGRLTTTRLDTWAKQHGVGQNANGRWTCGIDLLQYMHRYTILPPSPHPESGKPYQWANGRGLDIEPAVMPQLLAELLTAEPAPAQPPPRDPDPDSPADWYSNNTAWNDLLPRHGWTLISGDGEQDGSRWRHPTATSQFSATVRHGCLFVFSTSTAFEPTAPDDKHGYTKFRAHAVLDHGGDMAEAARHLREERGVRGDDLTWIKSSTETGDTDLRHLPDTFWTARPLLEHIRQAARSRYLSPDAVLGAVLCRVAALTSHTVELPAIVGSPVGLTYYAALIGPPESGKSAAAAVAAELIPAPDRVLDRLPVGSGEGFVEILFELVTETDPDNDKKTVKVKRQTRHAAIFHVDEGAVLADLGGRSGSTLLPTLRTAWTNGTLGNTNASAERRRILTGTNYVYGVTLGIQPELAAPLLADANAGTPQRFLWVQATEPDAPDHNSDWPGPLGWEPPDFDQRRVTVRDDWCRHQIVVHRTIAEEVRTRRIAALRGTTDTQPLDAHRTLLQLKTAALLAILDGHIDLTPDDWDLARQLTDTSRHVRQHVTNTIRTVEHNRQQAAAEAHSQRELFTEDKKEERARLGATRSVGNIVRTHKNHHDGCTRACLNTAIAGTHRKLVPVDEAIVEAVKNGWIEGREGRWYPGPNTP